MGWASPTIGVVAVSLTILASRLLRSKAKPGALDRLSLSKKYPPQEGPFVDGSYTERRQSVRCKGNHVKVFVVEEAGEDIGWGWVLDRSATGLCLKVNQAIKLGTILNLRPCYAPNGTPLVQAEVKNCRAGELHWEVGCQFVQPPAWSVLLSF